MAKENFEMDTTLRKRKKGVRFGPFALFLLAAALTSAIVVIIILSIFFVRQGEEIFKLQEERDRSTLPPGLPTSSGAVQSLWPHYRLPTHLLPERYRLHLQTFIPFNEAEEGEPTDFTTKGRMEISMRCVQDTNIVVLHAWNITVRAVGLKLGDKSIGTQNPVYDHVRNLVIIESQEKLIAGSPYTIQLDYEGQIVTENQGLYRSQYITPEGEKRWLAATQFQPYKARRAFPCFDEPAYRATFDITLKHDTRHNGTFSIRKIIERRELEDGWTETTFETSVKMPSYLMAFLISDFGRTAKNGTLTTEPTVEYGVISRAEVLADASFSHEMEVSTVEHGNILFDMSYSRFNSKLDMAAVPDFDSGAMENWGLILYRETSMHYRAGVSSATEKQGVALIVAHEVAHMWFGNAVTCSWWSETFLNEGFATFIEYAMMERAKPQWQMASMFTATETRTAYDTDSYESSIPLYREVETTAQITDMFGRITYQKGGAVLRMIQGTIGNDTFHGALKKYLAARSVTGITTYQHLLQAFSDETQNEINMTEKFEGWIVKSGFPLVTFNITGDRLTLRQERFLLGDPSQNSTATLWNIPISFLTSAEAVAASASGQLDSFLSPKIWLDAAERTYTEPISQPSDWVLANVDHYGYYRVNYDLENWSKLTNQLKNNPSIIPLNNRVQLIDDSFNLARKGILPFTIPFRILEYLRNETSFPPWYTAMDNLRYIGDMVDGEDVRTYIRTLLGRLYNDEFWNTTTVWRDDENEDYMQLRLRNLAIDRSCFYGSVTCERKAAEEFQIWKGQPELNRRINPHLKDYIFSYGVRNGDPSNFDFLLVLYNKTLHSTKMSYLRGAAATKDQSSLRRLLNFTIDPSVIRSQDSASVFQYIALFPEGVELAWQFLKTNWASLTRRTNIISAVGAKFTTQAQLDDMIKFYQTQADTSREKLTFDSTIAKIRTNIQWIAKFRTEILSALRTGARALSSQALYR